MADAVVRIDSITERQPVAKEPECGPIEAVTPAASRQDVALVQRLQAGEESAYEELIALYQQPVYNLVCRLLSDPGDSCDVVQEVFLKVFRNIGNFRAQSSLKTWVYRIALNEANNRRRWFSRHRKLEVDLDRDDDHARSLQESIADSGYTPFDLLLGSEMLGRIEESLRQLSPVFREAVVLRDIEELSYEEIAEILNLNMGTVKSRIMRGREALRKQMLSTAESSGWVAVRGMASGD